MVNLTREQAARRHKFAPRGSAKTLFSDRSPEILVSGPAGTGKSRGLLEKLHLQAMKYPGMRGLIVRKTATSLTTTALVTWTKFVIKECAAAGEVTWYGGSQQEPPGYRYDNGSFIAVGGMDKPDKIMSSEYDVVYVQEATELTITDWEAITTRLRNGEMPYQQIMADCNPSHPKHWLKLRCDAGKTKIYFSAHTENPRFYTQSGANFVLTREGKAYLAKLDRLTGVRRMRLRDGLWVAAEGMIYAKVWDESIHMIDKRTLPGTWRRVWAIDFGYRNPFVLQCWAIDPDGRAYLEWEIYQTGLLVEDAVRLLFDHISVPDLDYRHPDGLPRYTYQGRIWTVPKPEKIICDHDAEDRATFERHSGMSTRAADKTVKAGIDAFAERLKRQPDGLPRLFLMRESLVHDPDPDLRDALKPTCTAEEIPAYVWAIPPVSQAAAERHAPVELPHKVDDHGCDAGRYFVMAEDGRGQVSVRWLDS